MKPIVVFDMDGVLVHQRSSWRIVHEMVGTSNEDSFQAYLLGEIDDEEFMERDIRLWKSKGVRKISQVIELLEKAVLMDGFHTCMKDLKDNGFELAILSGGIDLLAERLGKEGGFDHILANGIEADDDGVLTGNGILRVPLRDKGSALRSYLGERGEYGPIVAVGDSEVDITMFQTADLSIAFRPETEKVARNSDHVVNEADLSKVLESIVDRLK